MLDKKYDFRTVEKKWQDYWRAEKVFSFSFDGNDSRYTIDTPPPTISGPNLHLGHLFSYSQIDIIARHKRMQGSAVYFPIGFDNNGLPTARFVQKKYNLNMAKISRAEFSQKCLDEIVNIRPIYESFFTSLGFSFSSTDKSYSTIDKNSQRISQLSFLDLFERGELSRRDSATLWCPECNTAIALSEIDTVEKPSVMSYIYFGIKGSKEKLEIATTRPELLGACVCVFVNPEDKKRQRLVGQTAISPIYNREVPIMSNPDVLMDKGTGVVMCCTFGDEADMAWQKQYNLPVLEIVSPTGVLTELAGDFAGLKIKDARAQIINELERRKILYKKEEITHMVATHERCNHEIEILTKPQWFINLLSHQQELYQAGLKCNWYPSTMQKRFLNWVDGLKWDWCISRQNFFGVPFPVWYCAKCGKMHLATRDDLPVDPTVTSPEVECECGCKEWLPETDVMDTWATSSLTPQIGLNLETGEELSGDRLPLSLRPTAHDNIRVWNFYTIAKSLLHFGKLPWTDIVIAGYAVDEKGDKISKSKGNAKHTPQELVAMYSADVVRYWAGNISIGMDTIFSLEQFTNASKLVQKIWNASKFVISFLEGAPTVEPKKMEVLDRWILDELKMTQANFNRHMERYEMGAALKEAEKLFWNFCDNYIELAKNRLYKPEIFGDPAKASAQWAASTLLQALLKLFCPYLPHITEEIYMDTFAAARGEKSIHLSGYAVLEGEADPRLLKLGAEVVDLVSRIRGFKSQSGVSLKCEIEKLTVFGYGEDIRLAERDIMAVGSVREIEYRPADHPYAEIVLVAEGD